ncbi:O-antigen polymerase [Maribellus sp. YY47]|uniref:O-antigen polymerase n=1 Tax=Maribellus sp. YY47 TaxID=2929486 RepID=UPI002001416A|nr:O-antigen polymerase [Maribellus sp. YY47]MCK3685170.1 oligosaccharide repeat unit polymerase [Maribellus sp. YY47]
MLQTVLIIFILVLIFAIYWKKSGRKFNIGSYILGLYILSLLSSFLLNTSSIKYSFEASFYFFIILILFLTPILKFNTNNIEKITPINLKLFNAISYIFIVLGICTYFFFGSVVYSLLFSGDSFLLLRTAMVGGEVYYKVNYVYYILTLYCQFYPIVLIFYFYSTTFTSNSKSINNLLLFSSTAYIINVLSGVGRDGFVLWPMSYIFAYFMFRNFMNEEHKLKVKKLLYRFLILFALIFIPITISRFYKDDNFFSPILSIVSYFGQQFGNFNDLYNSTVPNETNLSKLFPILGKDESLSLLEKNKLYLRLYGVDINVFSSFIGSFYLNVEKKLLFLLSFIINGMFFLFSINNKKVSLGRIIFFTFISQLPLHGIFYYKLAYVTSNVYMILVLLLSILFLKQIIINKSQ